jgi:dephospho-CoA kinase
MTRKIIMLAGPISVGKDETANFLVSSQGYIKFSFAEALKEFTSKKYNFDTSLCHTQEGKRSIIKSEGETVRNLLIREAGSWRDLDENVWIDIVIDRILKETDTTQKIVISDFRYPNEYLEIKKVFDDTTTVKIVREGVDISDLESEHLLDRFVFDTILFNNGTKEELCHSLKFF